MSKLLIVVDMQKDFIDGPLGTPEAVSILPGINEKIKAYDQAGDLVLFTADTHQADYMDTQEGKNLPVPHCLEGEDGWEISDDLYQPEEAVVITKNTFGSKELGIMLMELERAGEAPQEVELVGVCTDICVISNALLIKAFLPETKISVDSRCCAGVTPESHRTALEAMKACQIEITA